MFLNTNWFPLACGSVWFDSTGPRISVVPGTAGQSAQHVPRPPYIMHAQVCTAGKAVTAPSVSCTCRLVCFFTPCGGRDAGGVTSMRGGEGNSLCRQKCVTSPARTCFIESAACPPGHIIDTHTLTAQFSTVSFASVSLRCGSGDGGGERSRLISTDFFPFHPAVWAKERTVVEEEEER